MSSIALPAPSYERILIPVAIRLPKWTWPWERTKEDIAVEAITLDHNLGKNTNTSAGTTTVTLTMGSAVSANALIVVGVVWRSGSTVTLSDNTGLGLTWTTRTIYTQLSAPTMSVTVAYAFTTTGFATGKVLTVTFGASITRPQIAAASFLGASSTPFDVENGSSSFNNTAWASPTATPTASGDLGIGITGSVGNGSTFTNTPDAGWTNIAGDSGTAWNVATDQLGAMQYEIFGAPSAIAASGTWSGSQAGAGQAQAVYFFKAGAGAAAHSGNDDNRRSRRNVNWRRHHITRDKWTRRHSGIFVPSDV